MKFQVIRTDGKDNSNNKYLVINADEPYAGLVADLIEAEERRKGTWKHGDKTMREVMGIRSRKTDECPAKDGCLNYKIACEVCSDGIAYIPI